MHDNKLDDSYKASYNAEAKAYDQRSFDSKRGEFSARYKNELIIDLLNQYGSKHPTRIILDCPSGTGRVTHALVKNSRPFDKIYAYDISENMLSVNEENLPAQAEKVIYKVGNMKDMDLPDESVDEVVIASFTYLVPRDKYADYLSDIFRILKPGGVVLVEVSNTLCAYSPISFIKVLWHRLVLKKAVKSYAFFWELKHIFGNFELVDYKGSEFPMIVPKYSVYKTESKILGQWPILKLFSGKFTVVLGKPH